MSELFDEVDEELRREQLKKLWDRYSIFIIGVAVLIVAAVAGWRGYTYWEGKRSAEAGAAFEAAVALADQNKHAEAEAAFTKLAAEAPRGYRTLARLRAAAEAATHDPQSAVKLFDAIGSDASVSQSEQDLAKTRAAALVVDTAPYDEIRQRLEPITGTGRAFRHTARDLLAVSAWRSNDLAATRQWVDLIMNDAETPSSIRTRTEALQALLPPAAKS
ncbi:tetratricopeptide repeat protein [Bradyrhizobium sp. U87765 SZCCT0131]|uniref:tetratricopeptide repeat protein n=1 Tax=unclassified Bradyrhizobium TaxID=2631580 RepID=UPI001BAD8B21|nr:tetratricopeptide repeat protein [Bradyrhizobium sp. U87765 SZCCT0131]MBR1263013.1 tetratricopeptide repeat protein [Bradyrhizobium sp. U87765 SZCCT0134]MBR1307104.1 tetratricopeptide repeat protein [Bradyrhizobium sp. U87765 SZCCT0110]MBR1323008.1 tetratricopeptide repeat protein [Bradyrhizobium sp. U87765 SZCCT0109]MBR1346058.1 tetratricopeptide repeat protein [Bradyrhizobium sp. U87765 SZCCT0048]